MRHQFHCRRCEALAPRTFSIAGSEPRYAPDLPIRLSHLKLEVEVDPRIKKIEARVTHTFRVVQPELSRVALDQDGLMIREVKVGGKNADFALQGKKLLIELPAGAVHPPVGSSFDVVIDYSVQEPRRGIYFTGPDSDYPKKRYQVWSQGQDEDHHFWIPLPDYPNQKATTEVIARVPRGFTAVSNGALLSKQSDGKQEVFHYRLGIPQVCYLLTLVVAEFSAWEDAGPLGLPVQYFVEPGREDDGRRAFSHTPAMIEVFARKTGVTYPYEKYSQVAVQDFIFGGMENTSATTQTDRTLHDARAALDFSSDPLVSHELAHQWFGDLVTCRDWSHGWLNEGFATFMERVWVEENIAEYGSAEAAMDEAKYYSLIDWREYLEEDEARYRRPIVCNQYIEPIDLFDAHLYQKGGLVLGLIRAELGTDLFWKSVSTYLLRHQGSSVETLDFIRAIEDTTGRNLRKFFDQWVFGAGYPELQVTYVWDESQKRVELAVEQKQMGQIFDLSVALLLELEDGQIVHNRVRIHELKQRFFFELKSPPRRVRLDPNSTIPKVLNFPRPFELLERQLVSDPDSMGRIEAAHELAKVGELRAIRVLGRALREDRFWAVRAEVATALATLRSESAMEELMGALQDSNPKSRRAVVRALGQFKHERAARALEKIAHSDPSYAVEAEAVLAFAQTSIPLDAASTDPRVSRIERFLIDALKRESAWEQIRVAALKALALLPGIGRGERPEAMAALIQWSTRGQPEDARLGAISALGVVARNAAVSELANLYAVFAQLADEASFRVRMRLIPALLEAGHGEGRVLLEKIERLDSDGRVKRTARVALGALSSGSNESAALQALKDRVEKLELDHRKLRDTVEELTSSRR